MLKRKSITWTCWQDVLHTEDPTWQNKDMLEDWKQAGLSFSSPLLHNYSVSPFPCYILILKSETRFPPEIISTNPTTHVFIVLNCPSHFNNKCQKRNKNKHFLRPVHAAVSQDLGTGCSLAFPAREDTVTEGTDSRMTAHTAHGDAFFQAQCETQYFAT